MSTETPTAGFRQWVGYHAVLLGGIALAASALLALGDVQTSAEIAARAAEDLKSSLAQVVPASMHDNDLLADAVDVAAAEGGRPGHNTVYRARRGARITALAYRMAGQGYGGTIDLVMGVDPTGKLLGVRVISHQETPGLGDRIEASKSDWIKAFTGRSLDDPSPAKWGVKKDGGDFDQFTGATITPRAVVKTVKEGLEFFASHRAELLQPSPPATAAAQTGPASTRSGS